MVLLINMLLFTCGLLQSLFLHLKKEDAACSLTIVAHSLFDIFSKFLPARPPILQQSFIVVRQHALGPHLRCRFSAPGKQSQSFDGCVANRSFCVYTHILSYSWAGMKKKPISNSRRKEILQLLAEKKIHRAQQATAT